MKGTYWLLSGVLSLSMALSGTLTVLAEGADAGLSTETSALEQEAAAREMTVEYGNLRTLLKEGNLTPVSYTHLDVYKRQEQDADIVCQRRSFGPGI